MAVACAADGCTNQAALVQRELGKAFCSQRCISDYRCDTHQYLKASPTTYAVPIGSPLVAVVKGSLAAAGASPDAVMKGKLHSGGAHYLLPVAHVDALIEQLKAIGPLKHGLEEAETQDPKRQTTGAQGAAPPTTLTSAVSGAAAVSSPSPPPSSLSLASSPMSAASAATAVSSSSSSSLPLASPPSPLTPPLPGPARMDVDQPGEDVTKTSEVLEAILQHSDAYLSELDKFDFSFKNLKKLPPEIGTLTALETLDLRFNPLISLPPEIGNLTALKTLVLNHNQLKVLPPEIGNLTALKSLWLSSNQLRELPPEIGQLTALETLSVYNNLLEVLPPEIGNLTALEWLDLSYNQLTSLPATIGNLTALEKLDLRVNQLISLPNTIGNLTGLEKLHLEGNMTLNKVPPSILNIPNLTIINRRHKYIYVSTLLAQGKKYHELPRGPESLLDAHGMKDITPIIEARVNPPLDIGARIQALQSDHIYIG